MQTNRASPYYAFPKTLGRDWLAYDGKWRVEAQRIVAGRGRAAALHFSANDVYLVLGGKGDVGVERRREARRRR